MPKINSNIFIFLALLIVIFPLNIFALEYKLRASIENGLTSTYEVSSKISNYFLFKFEQKSIFSDSLSFTNEIQSNYSSTYDHINQASISSPTTMKLGDNYIKLKFNRLSFSSGLQKLNLGEENIFKILDWLNFKDTKLFFLKDSEKQKKAHYINDFKWISNFLTFQILHSSFDKLEDNYFSWPYLSSSIPFTIKTHESNPYFTYNELFTRFNFTILNSDLNLYLINHFDRNYTYIIRENSITPELSKNNTYALSLSQNINDYIFRSDASITTNKKMNYSTSNSINSYSTKLINFSLSIEAPELKKYMFLSSIHFKKDTSYVKNSFSQENDLDFAIQLKKTIVGETNYEITMIRNFSNDSLFIISELNWAINQSTDVILNNSHYVSDDLNKYSTINLAFKHYFDF